MLAIYIFSLVGASAVEKPNWRKGDYWQYAMGGIGMENERRISVSILGTENITIDNATYKCIVAKEDVISLEKLVYYDEESLATVKEIIYDNKTNKTEEKIYNPPLAALIQYPIFVGKKWNASAEWKNTSAIINLECTGKKVISTRAGKFDCYVVRANYYHNGSINFYQIFYISDDVGNVVRIESYANGTLVSYVELLSFRYNASLEYPEKNYVIVAVVTVVLVSLFVWYKIYMRR